MYEINIILVINSYWSGIVNHLLINIINNLHVGLHKSKTIQYFCDYCLTRVVLKISLFSWSLSSI